MGGGGGKKVGRNQLREKKRKELKRRYKLERDRKRASTVIARLEEKKGRKADYPKRNKKKI